VLNAVGDAIVLLLMCEPFATLFTLGTCVVYEIAQKMTQPRKVMNSVEGTRSLKIICYKPVNFSLKCEFIVKTFINK